MHAPHFEIPSLRALARHAVPRVLEGTVIPLALFVLTLRVLGVWGAMAVGLVWGYGLIGLRLLFRRRVPGVVLLGTATFTVRTLLAVLSHSTFIYFLQPTLGTAAIAGAFLLSVPLDRPLAGRLADDFCPLPADIRSNAHVRQFFRQISLLWAFIGAVNVTVTLWLLFTQSIGTYVVAKTAASSGLTVSAIIISTLWFRRSMARHGIVVTFASFRRDARS
jgi:intracellular septation protein A